MSPETYTTLKLLGLEIPLPRWAVYCVAALAIVGCGVFLWGKLLPMFDDPAIKISPGDFQQISESQRHLMEKPTVQAQVVTEAAHGSLEVWFYDSDGCVLVSRHTPGPSGRTVNAWLLDPNRLSPKSPDTPEGTLQLGSLLTAPAFAGDSYQDENTCGGVCVQPHEIHPGNFEWWAAEESDCWVKIMRRFEDQCTGYVWFDRCSNAWATRPDGSLDFRWTCCLPGRH